jgi:hypothetical protein
MLASIFASSSPRLRPQSLGYGVTATILFSQFSQHRGVMILEAIACYSSTLVHDLHVEPKTVDTVAKRLLHGVQRLVGACPL